MTTEEVSILFKALSDQTRLRMVTLLSRREYCNCEFVSIFGISQPAISRYIARLKEARLIHERRQGQWIYYSLNPSTWDRLPSFSQILEDLGQHDAVILRTIDQAPGCPLPDHERL
ncbi:ArsR/SmtB family transcription factor [Sulfobacillus thermosulfidooxidans]|uniref:ArsR/SmtB family transcription factor n=1 Tax=Sulfobacillus thermosulfidooxidans TaxID=28034 RepID=UPI0002E90926|nr:metalloregulator ArsR/SmtB family transcription factor [Sulfobacillus thermosulfidooxidans]